MRGYRNRIGLKLDLQGEFLVVGRVEAEPIHIAAEPISQIVFPHVGLDVARLVIRLGEDFCDIEILQLVGVHELGVPEKSLSLRFGGGDHDELDHIFDRLEKKTAHPLRIEGRRDHFDPILLDDKIVRGDRIGLGIERIAEFRREENGDGEGSADREEVLS